MSPLPMSTSPTSTFPNEPILVSRRRLLHMLAPVAKDLAFVEGVGVANPDLSHSAMAGRWWQGDPEGNRGLLTGFHPRAAISEGNDGVAAEARRRS